MHYNTAFKISERKIEIESQGQQDLSHLDGYTEAEIYTSQEALSTVQQEIRTAVRDARCNETATASWVRPDSQPGTYTQTRLCTLPKRPHRCPFLFLTVSQQRFPPRVPHSLFSTSFYYLEFQKPSSFTPATLQNHLVTQM